MQHAPVRTAMSPTVRVGLVLAVAAGLVLGLVPSAAHAENVAVTGSAFNYYSQVSLFGGPIDIRGHGQSPDAPATGASPSATCPDGGGTDSASDPDGARAEYGPGVLFGGVWPQDGIQAPPSGPLSSAVDCTPGEGGQVTASTSVGRMPAGTAWTTPGGRAQPHPGGVGPGPFVADEVHASCTADRAGATADVTIVGGLLEVEYHPDSQLATVLRAIPVTPAPNTSFEGTDRVGDRFRVTLNRQVPGPDGTLTVSAAHIELLGPIAVGQVVIGQVACGATAAAAPDTAAVDEAVQERPDAGVVASSAASEDGAAPAPTEAAVEPATAQMQASQAGPRDSGGGDGLAQAFNYYTDVSLFGGPVTRRGFGQGGDAPASAASPVAACPDEGGTDSATAPGGASAQYGPATLFGGIWPDGGTSAPPSGPLTAAVDCVAGERVMASTSVTLTSGGTPHPGGVGPGPLVADEVHSSCTSTPDGFTSEVRLVNGVLETSYDATTQQPSVTEPIPANPPPNYTRTGTLDHVGDSYRIVLNQQIENADGSFTVNAAFMELLGPTAVGEMVVGSATCAAVAASTSTGGSGAQPDSTSGRSTAGAGQGSSGTTARGQLANTGSDPLGVAVLGLGLLLGGALALQGPRLGRAAARLRR